MRGIAVPLLTMLLACSNDNDGTKAADGSDATGGTSGTGGTVNFRQCGDGVPCSPGATCKHTGSEGFGLSCTCDESQHFFCSHVAGGGGGPAGCYEGIACTGVPDDAGMKSCTQTNGYCTRDCACDAGCSMGCDGQGPAVGPAYTCDETCGGAPWGWCSYTDGACNYVVKCAGVLQAVVTGQCP